MNLPSIPIEIRRCDNYPSYVEITDSLKTHRFQEHGTPSREEVVNGLQKMVDEGYEIVRVSHFDEDGRSVEGMFETYVKIVNK